MSITQEEANKKMSNFSQRYIELTKNIVKYAKCAEYQLIPINDILDQHRSQLDCKNGCSYCCHYRVDAFTHEIVSIYVHLNMTLKKSSLKTVKNKIEASSNVIEKMTPEQHVRVNTRCPLLVDGKCSVYSVRPTSCAKYYSTSTKACEYLYDNPDEQGSVARPIPELEDSTRLELQVIDAVLVGHEHDNQQYELVTSLKKLFDNPSLIAKWRKSGKPIFN